MLEISGGNAKGRICRFSQNKIQGMVIRFLRFINSHEKNNLVVGC
jgi:hypothetical protein